MNLCCLKHYSTYSILFNSSNVGNFFCSWILKHCIKVQEKKKKVVVFLLPSLTKCEIRHFHIVVLQWRLRNVQKSVMLFFADIHLQLFSIFIAVAVVVMISQRITHLDLCPLGKWAFKVTCPAGKTTRPGWLDGIFFVQLYRFKFCWKMSK